MELLGFFVHDLPTLATAAVAYRCKNGINRDSVGNYLNDEESTR
jgi:hypothetical protein